MRLLALETATVEVGAALVVDSELAAVVTTRPGRRHAETLHPAIEAACRLSGVTLGELDALAIDVGPGLFTGLRVGLAAAKALAFALSLPLVACTSLDVLHRATRQVEGAVAAVIDMRRGELAFSLRPAGGRSGEVHLAGPEALASELAALGEPALVVGDGARRYRAQLEAATVAAGGRAPLVGGDELGAPPVAALALLASERLEADPGAASDPVTLEPVYLRPVDARINWATRDVPAGAALAGGGG